MIKNFRQFGFITAMLALFFVSHAQLSVFSNNKQANDNYLRALEYIKIGNPRTGGNIDSLSIAIKLLEKSVATDTTFTKAYLELSNTYWMFDFSYPNRSKYMGVLTEILPKAKAATLKAIHIDSISSIAYAQLARMNLNYEYNWNEALNNFAKAIRYDSTIAANYSYYGETLALKGKWAEAQQWIDKANKIEPANNNVLLTSSLFYNWKKDYAKAIELLQKINPPNFASSFFTALNYNASGKPGNAIEIMNKLYVGRDPFDGGSKSLLAYSVIKNGEIKKGQELINRIYELDQVVDYRMAACYVALKEYNNALDFLEKAYEKKGNWMIWLKYDNTWDEIRKEKRFKQLIKKMKF